MAGELLNLVEKFMVMKVRINFMELRRYYNTGIILTKAKMERRI